MAASSTELALRQVAFLLPPFHLRYLFSRIMSELLLFVYAHGFAAISAMVSKIASARSSKFYVYWEKDLRKTGHNHFQVVFFFANGFLHLQDVYNVCNVRRINCAQLL